VDASLTKQENSKFKRKFMVWQLVAAASIVFAVSTVMLNYWSKDKVETKYNDVTYTQKPQKNSVPSLNEKKSSPNTQPRDKEEMASSEPAGNSILTTEDKLKAKTEDHIALVATSSETPLPDHDFQKNRSLNGNLLDRVGALSFEPRFITADIHKFHFYSDFPEEKAEQRYPLWAGLKMAGGASAAQASGRSAAGAVLADPNSGVSSNSIHNTSKPGFGYSLGIVAGKRISKRIYVQSGLQYMAETTRGTTNAYLLQSTNQTREALFVYNTDVPKSSSNIIYTDPKEVFSTLEYITIPVQLGYMIVDRRIDWGISAGISSDFFMRNILSDNSGEMDKVITRSGDSSPFRSTNFSAIIGTEINYDITDNYSISLEPRYSRTISPVTKKNLNVEERRLNTFTIGLKLRYLF